MNELPLKMEGVSFHYKAGEAGIDQVGLECSTGSWTAVMGPSGAGKTTLLYCASGLLPVQQGSVEIAGQNIARMKESALTRMRRDHIGFVFQDYNLVEAFTCLQNVMAEGALAAAATPALNHSGASWRSCALKAEVSSS